ncbi:MAG: L-2-hydroxyglutarate oxidase [Gemmataceae bacterium]|nr:L-2-hydroxyglutarate oxidase [Gemmataceae bacterium]
MSSSYDVAVIGGGIVGLATALTLTRRGVRLVVVEAERDVAQHQTGHNSGVIHSGLYYQPGSHKARNCTEGRAALLRFCAEHGIPFECCGKVVVAVDNNELPALDELERRGRANGLQGIRRLSAGDIKDYEPNVAGVAGLWVPQTGIVDYRVVARKFAELVAAQEGTICLKARVTGVERRRDELILRTTQGDIRARNLINCGGLHSDRLARRCGLDPGLQIIPFRGEYYEIIPERRHLVKNLIYPVPDPRFPFLGVHFTRTIHGSVEAGPNAVLAFRREGYSRWQASPRDLLGYAAYGGFWRMAWKYWRTGLGEMYRSFSKKAFHRALQRLVPELRCEDIRPYGAGVRAQAVAPSGALVDDFRFVEAERMIHVLNAPSPAATASLSIGRTIAEMAGRNFGLTLKDRATTV